MTRIGVLLPNWIGDVVMATPALRALRQHYRDSATLVGIMRPYVAEVLGGTSLLDEMVQYRGSNNAVWMFASLAARLRRQRLDGLVLFTNSFLTALAGRLSGTPRLWGYSKYFRAWLLTDCMHQRRPGEHDRPISAVDYYLSLVEQLGCVPQGRHPELATQPADDEAAARVWQRLGLAEHGTILLNTGGAYGEAKRWPARHFALLARMLVNQLGASVLVLCGPAERDAAQAITRMANHPRVVSLADEPTSIGLSKACVKRGRLMVTTDSGPRHFAAAFGTPVVTLFGSTDPRWSENYHPQAIHLSHPVDCGPCARRVCPLGHHRCMTDLTPQQVFRAVVQLWESSAPGDVRPLRTPA